VSRQHLFKGLISINLQRWNSTYSILLRFGDSLFVCDEQTLLQPFSLDVRTVIYIMDVKHP